MRTVALIVFLQSAALLGAVDVARSPETITTEFESPAVLTAGQIHVVKELALRAGLPSVGKIYTYNIHPSSSFGIGVLSKESVAGREIRTSCLLVGFQKWDKEGDKHQKVEFRSGEFWVHPGIITSRLALFSSSRGERRIVLGEKTSLRVADQIFALFEAGKIRFKDPSLKKEMDDWRTAEFTLTSIHWETDDRGALGIAVQDRHAGMSIECRLEDDVIMVVKVRTWIS